MSKKHNQSSTNNLTVLSHAEEYRIIKHDLLRVLILNLVYLAVIVGLYVSNNKTHYLDGWFSKILHF